MAFEQELEIALAVAKEAGTVQMHGRGATLSIERKNDNSPVTQIDKRCEHLVRAALTREFPDDGFLGEESGTIEGLSGRRWIVDPIDGTRPYIRGIPTFSVLIALEENDEPVVGVIHLPGMDETYWASKGNGAFCNEEKISVSHVSEMKSAMGSALGFLEKADSAEGAQLFSLMKTWDYAYGFMDAYTYACIASGKIDLCVNLLDKAWDCAAAACLVTEAGGRFSGITGDTSVHCATTVLTNGVLHENVLNHFANKV